MTNAPDDLILKDLPEWARDIKNLPVKFEPCQDLVVVLPDPPDIGKGGLQKATVVRGEMEPVGTVIAAGRGKHSDFTGELIPNDWVIIGKKYMYSKYAGDDMMLDKQGGISPWKGMLNDDHVLVKIMRAGALLTRVLE